MPPSNFGFGAVLMIGAGSAAGSNTGDAKRPPGKGNSSEGIAVADSVTVEEVCAYKPGIHNIRIRIVKVALRLHMNLLTRTFRSPAVPEAVQSNFYG